MYTHVFQQKSHVVCRFRFSSPPNREGKEREIENSPTDYKKGWVGSYACSGAGTGCCQGQARLGGEAEILKVGMAWQAVWDVAFSHA